MIEFRCTHCDGVVRAPETHAGKKGRCPTCHEVVPIPEKSERLEPVEFPCEKCGHGMKAPGKFVGRQGKCAKCGHLMTIPAESVPHGESLPVAKPIAAKPATSPAATAPKPHPAAPAAAPPNPFAQAQPAAPKPNPFAQPQQSRPVATPQAPQPFAQPQPVAKPHPAAPAAFGAPAASPANDPFAGLGNFNAPAMSPAPFAPAMPAAGPYAAPAPYGPTAQPRTTSGGDPAGITSMILGIVSLVFVLFGGCCCTPLCIVSFITAGGGLIVGFFGNSGFRVAGIVMSAIALFLNVVAIGAVIALWIIGAAAENSGDQYEPPPWSAPFEPDFGSEFETEFGNDF